MDDHKREMDIEEGEVNFKKEIVNMNTQRETGAIEEKNTRKDEATVQQKDFRLPDLTKEVKVNFVFVPRQIPPTQEKTTLLLRTPSIINANMVSLFGGFAMPIMSGEIFRAQFCCKN